METSCLEDFMEVEVGERVLKKPCSESVGVKIIRAGSTVQTRPEPGVSYVGTARVSGEPERFVI